jgi:N-acetyl sugar amidotransferase
MLESRFGAPVEVRFCRRCVMPNQRPSSCNEFLHAPGFRHRFIDFDASGLCSGCQFVEAKENGKIDWAAREEELRALLARFRSKDGSYDCLVPGSGGKDSVYASHRLRHEFGMHPLTVTWAPHLYTDVGWRNFQRWVHHGGSDNYLFTPNGITHRLLTRNALLNLLHPFQPFIVGQKTFATKLAARLGIPLIFFGESPGEYGANIGIDQKGFLQDASASDNQGYSMTFGLETARPDEIFLGGKSLAEYYTEGLAPGDLAPYLPPPRADLERVGVEFHYLGYYLKWVPQECYYYAAEHVGFEPNPERTEGTYSKYNSIDDKIDGFFYYTTFIKFGYGRATQDASQEIRNRHITREEGIALAHRFDGELPRRYLEEFLNYVSLTREELDAVCDRFRSPHLWERRSTGWELRRRVS